METHLAFQFHPVLFQVVRTVPLVLIINRVRLATSASLELLQFRLGNVDLDPLYSDLLVHRKGLRLELMAKRLLL